MTDITPMGITFGSLGVLGPQAAPDIAAQAKRLGYRSFWTVEATGTDAMSLLGAASQAAPGLELGTGIIPVQIRTPQLAAMSAATLQSLSPDADVLLGVGISAPGILNQHGITIADKPVGYMREYVTLLRECLGGESVTFEGDYFNVKRFRLGLRLPERRPKIIMAALNPQMLRLAGEIADGVLLNYIPISEIGPSIQQVREGGNATIYAYVHACVGDLDQQADAARRDIFNYAMADGYANMFRRAGFETEVGELRSRFADRDRDGAVQSISEKMIQAIDFIGSEAEVTDFVRQNIVAGIEHPVLMPMPWGEDRRAVADATMQAAIAATG